MLQRELQSIDVWLTPATFSNLCTSNCDMLTYAVSVADYSGCLFSHWQDDWSTDRMRPFTTSTGLVYEFTAVYNCGGAPSGTSTVNVLTVLGDLYPPVRMITGYYTTLWQNGTQLESCFSPCTFTVNKGGTYQVAVADYNGDRFSGWNDTRGMNRFYSVTIPTNSTAANINLYANYGPYILVQSVDQNGNPITGYFVGYYMCYLGQCYNPSGPLSPPSETGFTPATFQLFNRATAGCKQFGETCAYGEYISVADYGACTFSHWQDNNSTDRMRSAIPRAPVYPFIAVYNCRGE
jgi:hypothetical protein